MKSDKGKISVLKLEVEMLLAFSLARLLRRLKKPKTFGLFFPIFLLTR